MLPLFTEIEKNTSFNEGMVYFVILSVPRLSQAIGVVRETSSQSLGSVVIPLPVSFCVTV